MTIATAPDCLSLTTRSSNSFQGVLHQLCSHIQLSSGRRKQTATSAFPSHHRALQRGTCLFSKGANQSTEFEPHSSMKCRKMRGANYRSELSVTRLRESAQMLAAMRMYQVQISMSYLSINKNNFRYSHIIVDAFDARYVSTPMPDCLSSCIIRRRPLSSGKKL
jgi:hypothetical protein